MLDADTKRFSFFQLVQLLERFHNPAAHVGQAGPAGQEVLRFRSDTSLAFPTSDVAGVLEQPQHVPPRYEITTTFLGLFGSGSPLPTFYVEAILQSDQDPNEVQAFVDVFHHRLISLFYRAWIKYRYHVLFAEDGRDPFSQRLYALMGLGATELTEGTGLPNTRLLRYVGLFAQLPRSASALQGLISDFFGGLDVLIHQCSGRWVDLDPAQRNAVGRENCNLGWNCSVGARIYSHASNFRVSIGPMEYDTFISFLPNTKGFEALVLLVQLFVRDRLDFDVELIVREPSIPEMQLSSSAPPRMGSRIGWTGWMRTARPDRDDVRTQSLTLPGQLKRRSEVAC